MTKLPTGNNIKVKVMDVSLINNGYIVCMSCDNQLLLWKKKKEIDDYMRSKASDEIHTPKE